MSWLTALALALLLCVLSFVGVEASIHEYSAVRFAPKGNAFVVHGGSEGIYSSTAALSATDVSANGDSFIR